MRTTDLSELAAFDAVARHRSFRRASEERGVTASAISHAVSNLEARVGIRLLNRTTRSVSLTDAGAMLLARLSPAFGDIGSALDALNQFRDTPFGKVRINAPNSIAPFVLGPVIGPLIAANPNLELEIVATDRLVDIVEEGFDAGIRLGESLRDGMTAVKISPRLRFAVVGSPGYFSSRPIPRIPADLTSHICIRNMYPSGVGYPWSFARNGEEIDIDVNGPLALHDHELMIESALAGVALAYVWEDRARPYVESGRLVACLNDWIVPEDWLYLYYPTRKYLSAGLRAVIEALRAG
ncbi:LysR substrate-binding domain-containing protein [Sphingomonas alpina]|uniref:LysR family transcriptional regulator n=1 Tax=Sphingomonas alpina TaxID=653931 RepID=A0A7H0LNA8_9SPHN|nr:LysR substrate-binding domain-containing protein [Sphingomonas alpina]QNQ11161.1 LysR family transcriptional regulator [Sphingomonas alpina]